MSIIFCTQTGTPVVRSLTMDLLRSCLMTRLSLNGLWQTMSLFLIQYSNAEINSLVYLDRCSSLVSIIHPSLILSAILAHFFSAEDRVLRPLLILNPKILLICLIEMSLCLKLIRSPSLLGSCVGFGRRLTQSALTTDFCSDASLIPTTILIERVLWPPYQLPCTSQQLLSKLSLLHIDANRQQDVSDGQIW